jgi:hypothetical protein
MFTSVAVLGAVLISGAYDASVQAAAPVGHRQLTAAAVPKDDTFLGSAAKTDGRSVTVVSKTSRSKRQRPPNPDVGFPDICTNCNQ